MRHDDVEVPGGKRWDLQPAIDGDLEPSGVDRVSINRYDVPFAAEPMQPSTFCIGVDWPRAGLRPKIVVA
jgi:hypothetical protein